MPTSLQITDSYLWCPYANCSNSRRANSGFIINAIAATFMNSEADSVDLLPKALSTINEIFEKRRLAAPVYSHLVILSHFSLPRPLSRSGNVQQRWAWMCVEAETRICGTVCLKVTSSPLKMAALSLFSACSPAPCGCTTIGITTTHNTPIMKIYCSHARK